MARRAIKVPTISDIPAGTPKELREVLEDIIYAIDLREGRVAGGALQAAAANDQAFRLKSVRLITSSELYKPSAGVRAILFRVQGAGGGGGSVDGQGAGTSACAGGGGSGGYVLKLVTALSASYLITIGAAGAGGSGAAVSGSAGGDTIVSDGASLTLTAEGGGGGSGHTATAGNSGANGGGGGAASGGDVNITGGWGRTGRTVNGELATWGWGSDSFFGFGGRITPGTIGIDATGYGAGGGGATEANETDNGGGGDGTQGCVELWEYA